MATRWKCDQCGTTTRTGMIKSMQDGPDPCENCQSERFSEIETTGVIHGTVDGFYTWLQGLPLVGSGGSDGSDGSGN